MNFDKFPSKDESPFWNGFVKVMEETKVFTKQKIDKIANQSKNPEKYEQYYDEIESYIHLLLIQIENHHKSLREELARHKQEKNLKENFKRIQDGYKQESDKLVQSAFDEMEKITNKAEQDLQSENN